MTLFVLLVLLVVVIVGASRTRSAHREARAPLLLDAPAARDEDESAAEMALRDPVEALLRHGTPADAARLAEQGVDLAALGYRARAPD